MKKCYFLLLIVAMLASVLNADIFISEYIEGSSNNKYIEVFNGTGGEVDLSDYKLQRYSNGGSSTSSNILLSGTLADGACIVYQNSSAGLTLPDGVTAINNSAVGYNGDDAMALYKISTDSLVDIFGRIGTDPGSAWIGDGGYSTANKTLVRKSSVITGITTNPPITDPLSASFPTLTTEWDLYATDTASYLGSHTMTPVSADAPVISNPYNSPADPTPSDIVTITATITDDGTIDSAQVDWGLATGVLSNNVTMTAAGDVYTCAIPAQADGETVFYTVTATDNDINTETSSERSYDVVMQNVNDPYFTPAAGNYSGTQSVEIFSSTPGAEIYYTTDGTDPDETSDLYAVALSIDATTTVKAKAYLTNYYPSSISEALYDFAVVGVANIYISEYIEGSSNNKAIELYNAGDNEVNLGFVEFWRISTGGDWAEGEANAVTLSGTLAPGDVYVVCNSSAIPEIQALSDLVGTSVCYFNGDDAMGLAYNGVLVDVVGDEGPDIGNGWEVAGVADATVEHTLVRKRSGFATTDWALSAGTDADDSQWIVSEQDDYANLGQPTPGVADVFISEVGTDIIQYVELYNAGTAAQDLAGWFLNQNAPVNSTPLTGEIGAGEYFVIIAGTVEEMITQYPMFTGNYHATETGAPTMINGSWLTLDDDSAKGVVDQFGSATSGAVTGVIYERTNNNSGEDLDTDWAQVPSPTPGTQNDNPILPVTLTNFTAATMTTQGNDLVVLLEWTVETESAIAGYNVYRSETDNFNDTYSINSGLIVAQNIVTTHTYNFEDDEVEVGGTFNYWLESMAIDGISHFYGPVSVTVEEDDDTSDTSDAQPVSEFKNIFPNPFNPSTSVAFSLKEDGFVNVSVYNVKGELVSVVFNGMKDATENGFITWDGTNTNGENCGSGIYFFRMEADGYTS
ncbi:MAG: lamin tail domain-containing protein, partial [Candidatus Zophobacter franzmannii]|nr:lamin tail domain-containing protein [Candidatus Zophobacter franzmannii]